MYLPEGFLSADVIVTLLTNIADGMHVWPGVVRARVMLELPFMATENILMACVKVCTLLIGLGEACDSMVDLVERYMGSIPHPCLSSPVFGPQALPLFSWWQMR